MKKLLSLLSVLTISGTAMPNVIAVSCYKKYNVRVKRQKPKKYKSIYELIKNKDLGELKDNYEDTILHAIVRLNPNISVNDIRIVRIPNNNMALIAHSYSTNTVDIGDDVDWVYFSISPQGMIGNSMFYNVLTNDVNLQPNKNKIQRPKEAPPTPPTTKIEEPIYATVLPKSQRNIQSNVVVPPKPARNLNNLLLNTNLGELPDNLPETILQALVFNNPNINLDEINLSEITTNSARINAIENSTRYLGGVIVQFTLNNTKNKISKEEKKPEPSPDSDNNIINKMIIKFNNLNSNNHSINLNRIKILDKNTKGGNLKEGDTYIATNNGVYLRFNNCGKIYKFNGLNFPIIDIELDGKGSAYVLNNTGEIYHLDLYGWGHQLITNSKIYKVIRQYNDLSKEQKQQKLNEINQHFQTLSENDKKDFIDKLKAIGTFAIGAGISGVGTKITVGGSASTTIGAEATGEAIEMTPLLSEGGLTAAETLSVAEGTAVVTTEGAVIGAEAGTAAALAPETLGLSLVIGGLVIAGTAIIWWLSGHDSNSQAVKHESHNQYNEIEKYYKFLAHDQLKLDININKWNKIKQIYQENANNYQEFKNQIKSEITNFHKEDHSGWSGSITDNDINTLINIIYNHFQEINNHFLSNPNHGWKIVTNTIGNYFIWGRIKKWKKY
ncbi:hypothetical protein [Spiroplasma sp. ald]|uniref:hypothetical protein n=1 Tax=Spiroplasma sp. ald TaxID=2490849 RepID=UPI0037DC9776